MHFQDIIQLLVQKKYYVFSLEDLCHFFPKANRTTLKQGLSRWKKSGYIASLKKGLYELTYPQDLMIPDLYIANRMYAPSYISLETALSHYSLIPEIAMAVTSLSTKTTRRFKNHHGLFIYRSIQPSVFKGYGIDRYKGYHVLMAEPEKALVDYLYFQTLHSKPFDAKAVRLDQRRVRGLRQRKLQSYAKLYGLKLKEIL